MIDILAKIATFIFDLCRDYWVVIASSSIFAGFLALIIIRKILRFFDILKH